MAYKNKTYVCFDADNDIHYYRLMLAWKQSDKTNFNFYNGHDINNLRDGSLEATIKRKLKERMENSKVAIVLIGEKTKNLYKFVRWEIELAISMGIPIIGVNINGTRKLDYNRCPPILRDTLAVYVSFNASIIQHALENWPQWHYSYKKEGKNGDYFYNSDLYKKLGL